MNLHLFIKTEISKDLDDVERILTNLWCNNSDNAIYQRAYNHIMQSGGKRIRVALTIIFFKMLGVEDKISMANIGAAIELIHTASLLHDDVIDSADLRRHKQTANSIFGNKVSIITGDMVVIKAFDIIAKCQNLELIRKVTNEAYKLAKGEILQLQYANEMRTSFLDYIRIATHKTSSLFSLCTTAGIFLERKNEGTEAAANYHILNSIGFNLGIIFQMADDYLDFSGHDKAKNSHEDLKNGIITIPIILLLQKCHPSSREMIVSILLKKNAIDIIDIENIDKYIKQYDIIAEVKRIIVKYKIRTEKLINKISTLKNKKYTSLIYKTLDYMLERIENNKYL